MERTIMTRIVTLSLLVHGLVFVSVLQADTFYYKASGTGGWGAATRWDQGEIGTAAKRPPSTGDTCNIPEGVTATVVDADQSTVSAIEGVVLMHKTSVIDFDVVGDFNLDCTLSGKGQAQKHGVGKLFEAALGKISMSNGQGTSPLADHYVDGGWDIEEGWLVAPQDSGKGEHIAGHIYLGRNGTYLMINDANDVFCTLKGFGTVTNATKQSWAKAWFGRRYFSEVSDFGGRFVGTKYDVSVWGRVRLTGTESTYSGNRWGLNFHTDSFNNGTLEVMKFGNQDEPSSLGGMQNIHMSYSGCVRYLGDGETTDQMISYRAQRTYCNVLDAGAMGGVKFTGLFQQTQADDCLYLGRFELTGSNSVPCVIAGGWQQDVVDSNGEYFSTYVRKTGSGSWRLADHEKNSERGVFEVRNGSLQYDSIRDVGVKSSLGYSTILYRDVGDDEPEKTTYATTGIPRLPENKVEYAILLNGTESDKAILDYTGWDWCGTQDRKVGLKGPVSYVRSSGAGCVELLGGVSAVGAGEKTLILDGTSTQAVIGRISDGEGMVRVVKEGTGTWSLVRNNAFSGSLDVRAGTLIISNARKPLRWFRFSVTDTSTSDKTFRYMTELELYDAQGRVVTRDLVFRPPTELPKTGNNNVLNDIDYRTLRPGEVCWGDYTKKWNYEGKLMDMAFDGESSTWFRTGGAVSSENPTRIVFRLPADAAQPVSYDTYISWNEGVKAFTLEGSADGRSWKTLSSVDNAPVGTQWASDGTTEFPGHVVDTAAHPEFAINTEGDPVEACNPIANVSSISVSDGATLKAEGEQPISLSNLSVDCAKNVGTIDGFAFAKVGSVNIINAPSTAVELPLVFSNCTGIENILEWSVSIAGKPHSKRKLALRDGKLVLDPTGLVLILR